MSQPHGRERNRHNGRNNRNHDRRRNPGNNGPRRPQQLPVDGHGEEGAVTLRFLGAAQTTTGSLHRLRTPEGDVILDCGLYQGHRAEAELWNRRLPLDPKRVRAAVLSHGHIDHCGALPALVRMGWSGPIWCTEATADLLPVMLLDAAHIQESDTERLNRTLPPGQQKEPLYRVQDAERALQLVRGVKYGADTEVTKGVTTRFVDAGHILGSAALHVTVKGRAGTTTLGFTGDLGRPGMPLLRDPEPLGSVEWYVSESTYGDRDHQDVTDVKARLEKLVKRAVGRGGKLLVPAFAVGRTQVLLYLLAQLVAEKRIPSVATYVDSPMATKATRVFERHAQVFDREARDFLRCSGPLFEGSRTSFVADVQESKALNDLEGPAIIISSSGMCEAGRILHHLRRHGTDPRNVVLFVGYQAEHTLGRRIVEGQREVRIYGDEVHLEAEVEQIDGLSAHADRAGLLRYVQRLDKVPQRTFLVHGEPEKIAAFEGHLRANGLPDVTGPAPGQWFRLL